jgi:hypothetical protein
VLIHHGGEVSRQYVERTNTTVETGERLRVDADYLKSALDQLLTLGVLAGIASWAKLIPSDAETMRRLHDTMYASMLAGRWDVVESFIGQA